MQAYDYFLLRWNTLSKIEMMKLICLQRKLQLVLSIKRIRIICDVVIASVFNMCHPYLEGCFNIIGQC